MAHTIFTGHLAQDCFKTKGDKTYELIPDWDEYMKTASHEKKDESTHKHKKKKKVVMKLRLYY